MIHPPKDYAEPEFDARGYRRRRVFRYPGRAGDLIAVFVFLWVVLFSAALIMTLVFTVTRARAHDAASGQHYSAFCCNGNGHTGDCQPVPSSSVRVDGSNYDIDLKPGDHWLVTKPQHFVKPQSEAQPSMDGQYHVCLFPDQDTLRCLYAPPPGA